jgi:phosphoglycerate dehydrogenase-like enzyme
VIPAKPDLTVCFAHVAYQFQGLLERRRTGIKSFQVWNRGDLDARIGDAHVLVISGLWKNDLVAPAKQLRYVQSIGAGTDQFSRELLSARGIRLASARGVNARAVSEHAIALMLALASRLPEARDNQTKRVWRDMIGDPSVREDELGGKTVIVVGTGAIGGRLVQLAKAFDMHAIGVRRDPALGKGGADSVHATSELKMLLPQADYVVLTCPLTKETEGLIDAEALGQMKRSAYLVNAARGRCVDEPALQRALQQGQIAGAALDVTAEEPLPPASPLWGMENVLITPHTAGETRRYEENVLDILQDNLDRLWRGETAALRNQVL